MAKPRVLPSPPSLPSTAPDPEAFVSAAAGAGPAPPRPSTANPALSAPRRSSPSVPDAASSRVARVPISVRLREDLHRRARVVSQLTSIPLTAMVERGLAAEIARAEDLYEQRTGSPVPRDLGVDLKDDY